MNQAKESASIVSLRIKNFLSISDVEIKSPGQVTQIVGRNNQGKTTVLKALEFAAKGSADGSLVKFGEESAEVVIELSDSTTIRRKITAEGKQTVDVKRDGFKAPQAQAFLDALFENSAFNPLELLDPKKRNDAILQSIDLKITPAMLAAELGEEVDRLPPLDFAQHGLKVLEQCHRYFYQRRAEANKDAAEKKKRWETYKADLPAASEEPAMSRTQIAEAAAKLETESKEVEKSLRQIQDQLRDAKLAAENFKKQEAALNDLLAKRGSINGEMEKDIGAIRAQIAELEASIELVEERSRGKIIFLDQQVTASRAALEEAEAAVPKSLPDHAPYTARTQEIKDETAKLSVAAAKCGEIEAVEKQRKSVDSMECEFHAAEAFAEALTARVTSLAGPIKAKVMASAEMPVKGLSYTSNGFLVDGVPVDNLSGSKALSLAVGVARKLAKKTKLICIDGAEALDVETYGKLREEIQGDGYTYFLTKVGEAFPATDLRRTDEVITMNEGKIQ